MIARAIGLALCAALVSACAEKQETRSCPAGELESKPCAQLEAMIQPLHLPAASGNAAGDSEAAAILGFRVFFDIRFSQDQRVRCESCHRVEFGFAENLPVSRAGVGPGLRNAPSILNAARHSVHMWDGRADTLWSQPLLAFENPNEMNFTRLELVHTLGALYPAEYAKAFGALPDVSDARRFPAKGKPGDPAFDGMASDDQLEVNRVVANVGKALEAYMRKLASGPSRVDRHLAAMFDADPGYPPLKPSAPPGGEAPLLTPEQARGVVVFAKSGCANCHSGPRLSDDAFHDLGVRERPERAVDEGRTPSVVEALAASPFNAAGPFFDGERRPLPVPPAARGGFRTPSLRNLVRSPPYGHDGAFETLEQIVDFHLSGGGVSLSPGDAIDPALKKVDLSPSDKAALIEFLKALEGEYPPLPWGQWPSGNG